VKVLHVLDHSVPVLSGYSFRSRSIVTFQRALGLTPVVLTSSKHGSAADGLETHDGIPHYRTRPTDQTPLAALPFGRELLLMVRLTRRIREVAARERPAVLHAHSPLLNGLPALLAGRQLALPVVYEARAFWEDAAVDHGTYGSRSLRYRLGRALETLLFKTVDAGVTICEPMRRDLIARGVPAARLHVVGNGVDTSWFSPGAPDPALRAQLGLDGGPAFGFIGSFYQYEGLDVLLDTAPEVARQLPGARFVLVGTGPEETALRKAANALGGLVVMPGSVPHDRVRALYASLDVFVYPRRRSRLTELVTPLKPLEAMSMGRCVVASDVGGLAELIAPEITGLLFRAEARDDLVRQAVRAGSDRSLQERLGRSARAHLIEHRRWERLVDRYRAVYTAATRARSTPFRSGAAGASTAVD
jgi:PEP-CTERM/exosortase A-associated glycosyltransferase